MADSMAPLASPSSSSLQWVGIDVSKRWLDVHLRPYQAHFRVANTPAGIVTLSHQLPPVPQVGGIVLEATGGYERSAALALQQQGYAVALINARQARK